MSLEDDTYIYHFTHARNLPGILRAGCIYCKSRLPEGSQEVDASHYDIQVQRGNKRVNCGPGGVLHDYVPFYFAYRSPMMYALACGNVEGYGSDTIPLIYVVTSVQRIRESGLGFVFSDGHPTKAFSRIYENTPHLDKVDWEIMDAWYWNDTKEDPDRKRRRQAEFLIHGSFPWDSVEFLAVKNVTLKERLEDYLRREWPHRIKPVRVEAGWYF